MQHPDEERAPSPQTPDANVNPAAIKERVYATFTGLAIVLVQSANADHTSALRASVTLFVGILAIAAAGFVADLLAHLASFGTFPHGPELRHLLHLTGTALGSAMIPLLALLLAVFGWLEVQTALAIAAIAYVGVLAIIGYIAVRRTRVSWWRQLIALGILVALGSVVIVIQQLAHGH